MSASTKEELLQAITAHGGICRPYNMVSGLVRMVVVDRWLNELLRAGLIEYVDEERCRAVQCGCFVCWRKANPTATPFPLETYAQECKRNGP